MPEDKKMPRMQETELIIRTSVGSFYATKRHYANGKILATLMVGVDGIYSDLVWTDFSNIPFVTEHRTSRFLVNPIQRNLDGSS